MGHIVAAQWRERVAARISRGKLDLVMRGQAGQELLESYNEEAVTTADENILNSTRSTDFLTPKTTVSKAFRDAVLELASTEAFARPFVNSGRLST